MGREEKIASWIKENRFFVVASVLIVLCVIVAVPIFTQSLNRPNSDYSTPALYLFSTIAQTMGAILGIVCAAFFAIFANMRASKDDPTLEVSKRLLVRDQSFLSALGFGLVTILVAVVSLVILYFSSNSQSLSGYFLTNVALANFTLGLLSIAFLLDFIINKISLYLHPVHLFQYLFEKYKDTKDINKAIDVTELGLILVGMGIEDKNISNSLIYLYEISKKINPEITGYANIYYDQVIGIIEKDISYMIDEERAFFWGNILKPHTKYIINRIENDLNNFDLYTYINFVVNKILHEAYVSQKYYPYYDEIAVQLDGILSTRVENIYMQCVNEKDYNENIYYHFIDVRIRNADNLQKKYQSFYYFKSTIGSFDLENKTFNSEQLNDMFGKREHQEITMYVKEYKLLYENLIQTICLLHNLSKKETIEYYKIIKYLEIVIGIARKSFDNLFNTDAAKPMRERFFPEVIMKEITNKSVYDVYLLMNMCEIMPAGIIIDNYKMNEIVENFDIAFAYLLFVKFDNTSKDKSFENFMNVRLKRFLGGSLRPNLYDDGILNKYLKNRNLIDQYVSNMYLKNMFY